jgi:hypothetical protein
MFDDQIPSGQAGQIPPNLPIGEPEDMFADVDPAPAQTEGPVPAQQDVDQSDSDTPPRAIVESQVATPAVGATPSAVEAGKLQPVAEAPPTASETPASVPSDDIPTMSADAPATPSNSEGIASSSPPPAPLMNDIKEPSFARKISIVLVIIAVTIGVGVLGYALYTRFFMGTGNTVVTPAPFEAVDTSEFVPPITATSTEESVTTTTEQAVEDGDVVTSSSAVDNGTISIDDQVLFGDTIDTDEDLLDDMQEIELGTDPRNWDTDGDGLSDGEEVLNWGTDPLNPDTDGDGFEDKAEIDAGYSPTLGGGARLFDVAPASENATST